MKKSIYFFRLLLLSIILMPVGAQESTEPVLPVIETLEVNLITQYSVQAGGRILSAGNSQVVYKGLCWSKTNQEPTVDDSKLLTKEGGESWKSFLSCLEAGTSYYIRAFAGNKEGTGYGDVISFTTLPESEDSVTDIQGNAYKTIRIGEQVWFSENLRTSLYNSGDPIATTSEEIHEMENPHYQWPSDGNEENIETYGRLYTWHVITDSRNLCPCSWHVPSMEEWMELTTYLGDPETSGGRLKEEGMKHWLKPNTGADNSSGFNALPAGIRDYTSSFAWFGQSATFWTSTENDEDSGVSFTLSHTNKEVYEDVYSKKAGYSVRCVRDR